MTAKNESSFRENQGFKYLSNMYERVLIGITVKSAFLPGSSFEDGLVVESASSANGQKRSELAVILVSV